MELVMNLLALVLKCITVYTAVISLFFLLPRRRTPVAAPKTRFAVLIPARNEEAVIGGTVRSLYAQDYPRELYDVFVIPNNSLNIFVQEYQCPRKSSSIGNICPGYINLIPSQ